MPTVSHQCLSAVSPLGTIELFNEDTTRELQSPMPFGSESAWDNQTVNNGKRLSKQVTNAFRQ